MTGLSRLFWAAFLIVVAVAAGTVDAIRHSPVDPGQPKGETP